MTDLAFAKDAARGGMAEIKLGKLAENSGSSEAVKTFGTRMVAEHTKAGDKFKEAAALEHITLPTDLAAKDQATTTAFPATIHLLADVLCRGHCVIP
jgi:putative membrane protein